MSTTTLVIRQPGDSARELEISGEEISLGRALDNRICLAADAQVSLYHAVIVVDREGGFSLTDLGSDAGTTINDEPIEFTRRLRDGDIIRIGEATIDVYFDESQTPPHKPDRQPRAAPLSSGANPATLAVGIVSGLALTILLAGLLYSNRKLDGEIVLENVSTNERARVVEETPVKAPPPRAEERQTDTASPVSFAEVEQLSANLSKRISGQSAYLFDREFLNYVRARTRDYVAGDYYERARSFRDVINEAFVGEQGLAAPLGYVLAMSQSHFGAPRSDGAQREAHAEAGEGLWQIPPALARSTGYIGRCGATTLADADQKCAARVAAAYVKFLTVDLFAGDFVYAVACYGMPPREAAEFRDQLPSDRRDFWKVLKSPAQRARVVNFFAAGVVGENPQKFGLAADKSLANLYPKN